MGNKSKKASSLFIIVIVLVSIFIPILNARDYQDVNGFDKGPSFTSVVPLKKTTFINFDEEGYVDDLAYLASVPSSVFYSNDRLYSSPLLYYQEKLEYDDDKYRILDAYEGIHYFMEDWMSYCNGKLDQMMLINVPKERIDSNWIARDTQVINSDCPYEISSVIALHDWSYSNDAVVAVVESEFTKPNIKHEGKVKGIIPQGFNTKQMSFDVRKPEIGVAGEYESFEIKEPYKYVVANMYWDNVLEDFDLQLYDNQLGMADADSKWNVFYGPGEVASSYVYNYGRWEIGVTYMPTQSSNPDKGIMETSFEKPKSDNFLTKLGLGKKKNTMNVVVDLYPGVEVDLKDPVPYGCRDIEFKLKWNNPNVALGFVLLDTYGAETASAPSKDEIVKGLERGINERVIKIEKLGETAEDETYKFAVFTLDKAIMPVDFSIEYSWSQNYSRYEGDCLESATNGAIFASMINAPLLYISKDTIKKDVEDALYKLGVKNIYLINFGGYLSKNTKDKLKEISTIKKEYVEYKDLYDDIREKTNSNDVIFSTVDPWTYYYSKEQIPVGEYPGALFIGPAAYIAAHHGSPVLIVDNHPELSQAIIWHTRFWQETANKPNRPSLPSVACMVLTGRSVLEFLKKYDYNLNTRKENIPTMITVADQFDIGPTWDRTFTGALIPGRFCSGPVDIAYWISRSVFYPALIFENPALKGTVQLVDGSKSTVKPYIGKLMEPRGTDLVYIEKSKEKDFVYPILHTYNVYLYNFNRDASKHWGGVYTTANGIIPYETPSPYSIDQGTTDKVGAFYPDLHETEVTPLYAERAGYSNCFSTNYDVAVDNLNKGVIMWMESCHGGNGNYGSIDFWNPDSPYVHEPNPWRAYERPLLALSNIHEATKYFPEILKEIGFPSFKLLFKLASLLTIPLNIITVDRGSTEDPDQAVMNPQLHPLIWDAFHVDLKIKESKGLSLIPIIGRKFRSYGTDGIVIDPSLAGGNVLTGKNGIDFDNDLENLHSCGMNAVSCLIAHTYLHQVFIRHGTAYQIMDPWSTSWYSGIWLHSIPRQLALGHTIGQAYENGMAEVGIQYLVNQWWWDLNENVIFYGDPDLRVWTPSTEWDNTASNYWEKKDIQPIIYSEELNINGHTPFGAENYPYAKEPKTLLQKYFWLVIIVAVILLLIIALGIRRKK